MMSNGYKPTPLELCEVKLTPAQELLVEKLAENAHNVWAKDRVKQGWTYGIQQVDCLQRVELFPHRTVINRTSESHVLFVCLSFLPLALFPSLGPEEQAQSSSGALCFP